jgi:hypothetical protein
MLEYITELAIMILIGLIAAVPMTTLCFGYNALFGVSSLLLWAWVFTALIKDIWAYNHALHRHVEHITEREV